jgi:hypothetical protein
MAGEHDTNPTEGFRSVAEMAKPDGRQCHLIVGERDGPMVPKSVHHQHAMAEQYAVSAAVPEDIRIQWDTARNLWLYAWHVWRFYPVAEKHVYAVLEMSLRIKLGHDRVDRPPSLKALMDEAIRKKLLRDEPLEYHQAIKARHAQEREIEESIAMESGDSMPPPDPVTDSQLYCKLLASTFPRLRNRYAHGSSSVTFTVGRTFSLCRDLINQLFTTPGTTAAMSGDRG